jgi:hypothetical protein
MQRSTWLLGFVSVVACGLVAAQQRPPATIPASVQADLKARLGSWTLEDTAVTNGTSQRIDTGTMECKAVAGGIGVLCSEQDTGTNGPNHHRVDLFGYDEDQHAVRMSVLEDDGAQHSFVGSIHGNTNTIHINAKQPDGKAVVITVIAQNISNDETRAHTTVELGGVKVSDMTRTYHRVK